MYELSRFIWRRRRHHLRAVSDFWNNWEGGSEVHTCLVLLWKPSGRVAPTQNVFRRELKLWQKNNTTPPESPRGIPWDIINNECWFHRIYATNACLLFCISKWIIKIVYSALWLGYVLAPLPGAPHGLLPSWLARLRGVFIYTKVCPFFCDGVITQLKKTKPNQTKKTTDLPHGKIGDWAPPCCRGEYCHSTNAAFQFQNAKLAIVSWHIPQEKLLIQLLVSV